MKKIMKIFVLFLALFVLVSCGEKTASKDSAASSEASTAAKKRDILNVTVSIPPQAYIVKSVGKDKVRANTMMEPSSTPETYEPGPKKMADLKDSALYLKIGVPFEAASIEKLAADYKNIRFADMAKGINFRKMEGHFHPHHHCDKGCAEACADCKCGCKEGRECGCKHGEKLEKEECGVDACSLPGFDAPKEEKHEHKGMHEGCPHHKEHHCVKADCEGCEKCDCGCKDGKGCDCKEGKGCADCKCGCKEGKECSCHHGDKGCCGHHHGMHDPHVWLDPMNLIVMTDNTVAELSAADPDNAAFYRENGEALKAEIKNVSDEVAAQLKDVAGKSLVVHHPAFGYFADRFGLKQVPLEIEGKEPGAVDMAKVVDFIKKNNAKAVFMQAQIPDSVIKSVAEETKVRVITLDPLKENVLENIKETAKEIKGALIDEK
ncbi:zinc ABC transporter substrate-binding protein [bacterium]|nr:zinc ABC transporter substrate-binding protein [bacterium]